MNLVFDMDDTIVDFIGGVARKARLPREQITADFINTYPHCTFEMRGFFNSLEPLPNAIDVIRHFNSLPETDVFIASKVTKNAETATYDKFLWLERYMPFIDRNQVFITGNMRSVIANDPFRGGLLIDDNFENCKSAKDFLLLKTELNGDVWGTISDDNQVSDWKEIEEKIWKRLEKRPTIVIDLDKPLHDEPIENNCVPFSTYKLSGGCCK